MFRVRYVWDVECGMWTLRRWNVRDVGCSECWNFGMWVFSRWDVWNAECLGGGKLVMRDV